MYPRKGCPSTAYDQLYATTAVQTGFNLFGISLVRIVVPNIQKLGLFWSFSLDLEKLWVVSKHVCFYLINLIYRPSFEHENACFRENMGKPLVFNPIRTQRSRLKLVLVPEIIDPVFAKTSQNARFLLSENERFGHVFVKTGSINSGDLQVVFKYCNCVEEEISWFSLPKSGHVRKQVLTKSVEFAKVECS